MKLSFNPSKVMSENMSESVNSPDAMAAVFAGIFDGLDSDRENLVLIGFDSKNQMIGSSLVAIGGMTQITLDKRTIMRDALTMGAAGFALAHNHPSGNPTPSGEDISFTRGICAAAATVELNFVDSMVIGKNGSFRSIREIANWNW